MNTEQILSVAEKSAIDGYRAGVADTLAAIEREAVAVFRDGHAEAWSGNHGAELRAKLSTLVGLIKQLSPEPVSWITIYERVEAEALRQTRRQDPDVFTASDDEDEREIGTGRVEYFMNSEGDVL